MEDKESIGMEEMKLLLDRLISKDGFLVACRKTDKNLVSKFLKKLEKYKITDSEFLVSCGTIGTIMDETRKELLTETVLQLSNSGLLDLGVNDEGEVSIVGMTDMGKKVARQMEKDEGK